jgi:hypothetical protein
MRETLEKVFTTGAGHGVDLAHVAELPTPTVPALQTTEVGEFAVAHGLERRGVTMRAGELVAQ